MFLLIYYLFIFYTYIYFRLRKPKLLNAATEAKVRYIDFLFTRSKAQIAMLDDEKLRDMDVSTQQEINILSWLHTMAPAFPVNGSKVKLYIWQPHRHCVYFVLTRLILFFQITIIHKPQVFYNTLLEKCKNAKKRITLASLYLGTGILETELVSIFSTCSWTKILYKYCF